MTSDSRGDDSHMVSKEMRNYQFRTTAHINDVLQKHSSSRAAELVSGTSKRLSSAATGTKKRSSTGGARNSIVQQVQQVVLAARKRAEPTKFHQELLDRRERYDDGVAERSQSSMATESLLPRLTAKAGMSDVRDRTRRRGVPAPALGGEDSPRAFTPSATSTSQPNKSVVGSGAPRAQSQMSNASTIQQRSVSPTTTQTTTVVHPDSRLTFSPRRRTQVEIDRSKFQAGCGILTQLDRAGETFVVNSQFSERHNLVARRRYQLEQVKATEKLQKFYEKEDHRESALDNKVNRENQGRIQQWLEILAVFGPAAAFLQTLKENRANRVLASLFQVRFISHIMRRRARIHRQNVLKERQEMMLNRPTKAQLRRIPCMRSLADETLMQFIDQLEKECYIQGEWIAKEGTIGTGCYILHRGCFDLVRSTKKANRQGGPGLGGSRGGASGDSADQGDGIQQAMGRRGSISVGGGPSSPLGSGGSSSSGLGPNTAVISTIKEEGQSVGENYLLTEEMTDCGIYAREDTDIWILTRKAFQAVIDALPSAQSEPVHRMMDERRELNMVSNRTLSEAFVRKSSKMFALWTDAGIRRILEVAKPSIYRRGDVIVPKGQYGKTIIFVVSGRVEVSVDGKKVDVVREGHALGEIVAGRNQKDRSTALKAVTICDCWLLAKGDFSELFCHESPMAFLPAMMTMVDEGGKTRH